MRMCDFREEVEIGNERELAAALAKRYTGNANLFWLDHPPHEPTLAIHVKDDWAVLNYFPQEWQAGFVSRNGMPEDAGFVSFPSNESGEEDTVPLNHLVPIAQVYVAAEEFLRTGARPSSIEWFEL